MLDRDLAAVARHQRGVITQPQLDDLGASDRQRQRRLDSGALVRLHESVLAVAGAPATWERDAIAALAAVPAAVLGHTGAARVHRMQRVETTDRVSLLGPFGTYHDLAGVEMRRTRFLPASHVTVVGEFRVTTRARTLVDLAADLGDGRLRRLLEDELGGGRVSWDELAETFGQLATRGRPGIGRMRRTMERIEGRPPTESELERMYLRLLESAGLPAPSMQVQAPWSDVEPGRVDGMYVDQKSIVELDGRTFHQRSQAFERDRRRDQLATVRGYVTARFTYQQIRSDPDHVLEVTRYLATRLHG